MGYGYNKPIQAENGLHRNPKYFQFLRILLRVISMQKGTSHMRNRTIQNITGLLAGILFTLFFISLGLITAIQWRGLYYYDMNALNIPETSGYSEEIIRENYDALIDYCSPFFHGDLSFPTLPASAEGLQHFAEVKVIFVAFYYLLVISLVLLILVLYFGFKQRNYKMLRTSAATTIILPVLVGAACAINFDRAFTIFHKIFFRNNYWLFDPATDPVIDLLPSEFFLHCAIVIIVIVLLGGLLQYLIYHILRKRTLLDSYHR